MSATVASPAPQEANLLLGLPNDLLQTVMVNLDPAGLLALIPTCRGTSKVASDPLAPVWEELANKHRWNFNIGRWISCSSW